MLSEKYAFMIAPQAMYLESRRHQIGIWHFYHPAFLEAKGKTCDIIEEGRKIKMSQDKKTKFIYSFDDLYFDPKL